MQFSNFMTSRSCIFAFSAKHADVKDAFIKGKKIHTFLNKHTLKIISNEEFRRIYPEMAEIVSSILLSSPNTSSENSLDALQEEWKPFPVFFTPLHRLLACMIHSKSEPEAVYETMDPYFKSIGINAGELPDLRTLILSLSPFQTEENLNTDSADLLIKNETSPRYLVLAASCKLVTEDMMSFAKYKKVALSMATSILEDSKPFFKQD